MKWSAKEEIDCLDRFACLFVFGGKKPELSVAKLEGRDMFARCVKPGQQLPSRVHGSYGPDSFLRFFFLTVLFFLGQL